MSSQPPDWVKHAIFYQIFPDRFARSHRVAPPAGVRFKPWGSPPEERGFQGGDLYGVAERLDYLVELGINALYLNPVFASAANHRYHTFDYYKVDPLLGGDAALRHLLDEAHARGVRIILDGVFNHASRGFWPFHHILENGPDSPYVDWFIIEGWPLRPYDEDNRPPNYVSWWSIRALPKLNMQNPEVQQYIFDVARYWIEFGIDGWRLDVPSEIDDDVFWREFRRVVKKANPDAYICGEIWGDARRWLQGDQFDGVMNYLFSRAVMSFFGSHALRADYNKHHFKLEPLDATGFADAIAYMHGLYDREINQAQLNLLGSHDTARALWIMGDDVSALQLAVLFQMTMPGAPCVYYGDEVGLSSGEDPLCREAFPWYREYVWNQGLRNHYASAIALRRRYEVLRTGSYEVVYAARDVFIFVRRLGEEIVCAAFNTGELKAELKVSIPDAGGAAFLQIWPMGSADSHTAVGETLNLRIPGRNAVILASTA